MQMYVNIGETTCSIYIYVYICMQTHVYMHVYLKYMHIYLKLYEIYACVCESMKNYISIYMKSEQTLAVSANLSSMNKP